MPRVGADGRRGRLTREGVLRGALTVADAGGLAGLTIRSLATELEVKPMAVYHHVANKDAILDGIVDLVFREIELPVAGGEWREEIRRRAASMREALRRHPWAIVLMESRRSPGAVTLHHHDVVLGTLRRAGFSVELAAHAYALLDAYVYGFALQETTLPFDTSDSAAAVTGSIMGGFAADEYPYLVEIATDYVMQPGYAFGNEFEFGLGLILDGLSDQLARGAAPSSPRRRRASAGPRSPRAGRRGTSG
jgi:AcrR family transcriptional regulator